MSFTTEHLAATDIPNNIFTRTLVRTLGVTVYIGVTAYCLVTGKDRLAVATAMVAKLED